MLARTNSRSKRESRRTADLLFTVYDPLLPLFSSLPRFRSVTRRIFKKIREHEAGPTKPQASWPGHGAHTLIHARVLCSRFDCISWLPHTRANANAHKRARVTLVPCAYTHFRSRMQNTWKRAEGSPPRDGTLLRRNFVKIDQYNCVPSLFVFFFFRERKRYRDVTFEKFFERIK